jgi:hypothetical protein
MRDQMRSQTMRRPMHGLSGLGCACTPTLGKYAPPPFVPYRSPRLGALGAGAASAGSIVSGGGAAIAATGPVGLAVGVATLIAGAIGLIHTGTKPQRAAAAAQMIQQMQAWGPSFPGRNLNQAQLGMVWFALMIDRGLLGWISGDLPDHPSGMTNIYNWTFQMTGTALQAALRAGPGATITIPLSGYQGVSFSATVTVPQSLDATSLTDAVSLPVFVAWCSKTNPAAKCQANAADPLIRQGYILLTDNILYGINPALPTTPQPVSYAPTPAPAVSLFAPPAAALPAAPVAAAPSVTIAPTLSVTPPTAAAATNPTGTVSQVGTDTLGNPVYTATGGGLWSIGPTGYVPFTGTIATTSAPTVAPVGTTGSATAIPAGYTAIGFDQNSNPVYQNAAGQLYSWNGAQMVVFTGTLQPTASNTAAQTQALIQQQLSQGASQTAALQAALAQLQSQGTAVTPAVQSQVQGQVATAAAAPTVATAGLSDNSSLLIAGALGVAAVLFATARPAKRRGSGRSARRGR